MRQKEKRHKYYLDNLIAEYSVSEHSKGIYLVGLMEPFEDNQGIKDYRRRLGMKYAATNINCKIWAFIDEEIEYDIVRGEDQMLNLKLNNQNAGIEVIISLVYANCTQGERLHIWESMANITNTGHHPWMVGGDFNVICNEEKNWEAEQSQRQK